MTGDRGDKPESDVEADDHVGRASGEDDFDAGQTGAEARAEDDRHSSDH